jgi:hypothetical protein
MFASQCHLTVQLSIQANASCESLMKTLKREEIYANNYRDLNHLLGNIEVFIEHYYNRCRLHSALGYRPPEEFEPEVNTGVSSAGATMSFFRHGEVYQSHGEGTSSGERPKSRPRLILPMSLQLIIPQRVALQQSSPPLHQPSVILEEKRNFEKEKLLNCMCTNSELSQQKGSPQYDLSPLSQVAHSHRPCFVPDTTSLSLIEFPCIRPRNCAERYAELLR